VAFLERMQRDREAMAERTLEALERLGVRVSRERVAELAKGAVVTRPHIARALVEAGHVASEQEAFDRYLGSGKPAAQPRPSPSAESAIAAVREAGGVAGLAHPVFLQDADAADRLAALPRRLDALGSVGLQAIECAFPDGTPELTQRLELLARERGLIVTGGSDYHGPGKAPFAPLGQPSVEGEIVERLRSARPART
jgi:3',5'-nucleoside bisphosphate phosphatase